MADITSMWYEALEGKKFAAESINCVKRELDSSIPERRAMAYSILFMAGGAQARKSAFKWLKRKCYPALHSDCPKASAIILVVFEHFSKQELKAHQSLAEFAYRGALQSFAPIRVNSMRVLRRLALFGDRKAIEILKISAKDPDPNVAKAARVALRLAFQEDSE